MEMDLTTAEDKGGVIGRGWSWFKALFDKFKVKIGEIVKRTKKLGQDDPRRVVHSLKVALALTFVSLVYYTRPLYDGFGVSGIWAVLTVVVVFEFTVGGTLSKSLNRGFATLSAGVLGVGASHLASLLGKDGDPILLGFLVFLIAGISTFIRFFPQIKRRYDYGVLIFILTFSMVAVSGYRVENIIDVAQKRLLTILVGVGSCMIISVFVCPVWAGQDLHNLIALNLENLASFLQGFGGEYFQLSDEEEEEKDGEIVTTINSRNDDKTFLQKYKSALNSKPTEESLANFAWWEPSHGNFGFRHPWKQYLKIGGLIRQCAYHIEALNGYLKTDFQAPPEFKKRIEEPCSKLSSESGKALKELAASFRAMKRPCGVNTHVGNCQVAINELKAALEASAAAAAASLTKTDHILEIIPAITVASLLIDITKCVENISESICQLSEKACFKTSSEKLPQLQQHRGTAVVPLKGGESDAAEDHVVIDVKASSSDSSNVAQASRQMGIYCK